MAGLALKLREGTANAHRSAERAGYVRALAQGQVDRETYIRQLLAFHHIYGAIEAGFTAHAAHPAVSTVFFPQLARVASIESDLAFLAGPDWRSRLTPSPVAARYVARIRASIESDPALLAAHAYTRYLGDLSGGQVLRKLAARSLQLPGDDGLGFFDFPAIADHAAFKNEYRGRLDALPVDDATAQAIVDEANAAFALNEALFDELVPPSSVPAGPPSRPHPHA